MEFLEGGEKLPNHCKDPILENVNQKIAFFDARSPSNLVYSGAFRKTLGSVSQKWISQNSTKGEHFGSAGGRIPGGERGVASAPLKSAGVQSSSKDLTK